MAQAAASGRLSERSLHPPPQKLRGCEPFVDISVLVGGRGRQSVLTLTTVTFTLGCREDDAPKPRQNGICRHKKWQVLDLVTLESVTNLFSLLIIKPGRNLTNLADCPHTLPILFHSVEGTKRSVIQYGLVRVDECVFDPLFKWPAGGCFKLFMPLLLGLRVHCPYYSLASVL